MTHAATHRAGSGGEVPASWSSPPLRAWDVGWRGHWIGTDVPPVTPDMLFPGGSAPPPRPTTRVLYRTTVDLATAPPSAPARVSADSRYVLAVNGREVGRGPVRSQPRRLRYDEHDLAPHLVSGTNAVSVLVTHYGRANSYWHPAAPNPTLGRDAVLVLEADLGDAGWLVTDETWRVHRSSAWDAPAVGSMLHGLPVEVLDARALPHDWRQVGFDDTGWARAQLVPSTHIGSSGRTRPPSDPYGALLPRPVAALGDEVVLPASVASEVLDAAVDTTLAHPFARVAALGLAPAPATPGALPLSLELAEGRAAHVAVDFGRIVAGTVRLSVDAPAGTVVELMYREKPLGGPAGVSEPETGARYTARGHDDDFEAVDPDGLRYAHLVVHGATGTVVVREVSVRERLYPWSGDARFASSDPRLDALYASGVRTVRLNSHDAFLDCPTREQRSWVGDGVVHQMVHLATNADWRAARYYLELGDSPRADGILPMSVAGELEHGQGLTIPDWSLHWVHGVQQLHRATGDAELARSLLPTAVRVLRWYLPYLGPDGVLTDVPEWNLVDWSSVFTAGRSSILTALWARGLRDVAEVAAAVGNPGDAQWALGLWELARAGFEVFWDEARGAYVDHVVDGRQQPAASQVAGAAAVVSRLAPQERWARVVDRITDPERLVVRSWIGGGDGGYDAAKMLEQLTSAPSADWDVDEQVVIAQPFMSYLVHDAVAAAGRADLLPDLLLRWSVFLEDYDTLGECWGWGTPVHGWSATPTRDLVSHVLGVTPAEPGWAAARVAPALGRLAWAEGSVPTPHGPVSVAVDAGRVRVDSPVPVVLALPGGEQRLDAGAHELEVVSPPRHTGASAAHHQ